MPIPDEALGKEQNRCVVMKGSHLVLDAIAELDYQGGQEWWHLVVDLGGGKFAAGRFASLHDDLQSQGEAYLKKSLAEIALPRVESVDQDSTDADAAEERAQSSPGNLLVVTKKGRAQGLLFVGGTRSIGETFTSSSLTELAGNYVDLKKYRAELLNNDNDEEGKRT